MTARNEVELITRFQTRIYYPFILTSGRVHIKCNWLVIR